MDIRNPSKPSFSSGLATQSGATLRPPLSHSGKKKGITPHDRKPSEHATKLASHALQQVGSVIHAFGLSVDDALIGELLQAHAEEITNLAPSVFAGECIRGALTIEEFLNKENTRQKLGDAPRQKLRRLSILLGHVGGMLMGARHMRAQLHESY